MFCLTFISLNTVISYEGSITTTSEIASSTRVTQTRLRSMPDTSEGNVM